MLNAVSKTTKGIVPHASCLLSGIQPTGVPHLGNYLGALRSWVRSQETFDGERFFCIADLHALTDLPSKEQIQQWRPMTLAALLALGLDPKRSTIFFQSSVITLCSCRTTSDLLLPQLMQHGDLMAFLEPFAQFGHLARMTTWKVNTIDENDNEHGRNSYHVRANCPRTMLNV